MTQSSSEQSRTPRPEKVAVVAEIRERLVASQGALLTEYRGLDTATMAALRGVLAPLGGSYKVYKNTLFRLAVRELGIDCEHLLVGPTAVAFVEPHADGRPGDAAAVAKALLEFKRADRRLVIKGGLLGTDSLGPRGGRATVQAAAGGAVAGSVCGSAGESPAAVLRPPGRAAAGIRRIGRGARAHLRRLDPSADRRAFGKLTALEHFDALAAQPPTVA